MTQNMAYVYFFLLFFPMFCIACDIKFTENAKEYIKFVHNEHGKSISIKFPDKLDRVFECLTEAGDKVEIEVKYKNIGNYLYFSQICMLLIYA